jgi:hypothetical protein
VVEDGAIHVLKACKGHFFVQNDRSATMKGWTSGVVSDVEGDEGKVVIHLTPTTKWDKKPPVEVPLSLIIEASRSVDRSMVYIRTPTRDITIQEVV